MTGAKMAADARKSILQQPRFYVPNIQAKDGRKFQDHLRDSSHSVGIFLSFGSVIRLPITWLS